MVTNIVPPGYQGLPSFIISPRESIAQRRRLAQVLGEQASSTAPVQSWTQALARVLQGGVAGLGEYSAGQMERERQSALARVLGGGGGMSNDQLMMYGALTGEDPIMQIAKFRADQKRQQFEDERQAEMLRLAKRAADRADNPVTLSPGEAVRDPTTGNYSTPIPAKPTYTPYESQNMRNQANEERASRDKVKAAQSFLEKVDRIQQRLKDHDEAFGIVQSNPIWRGFGNLAGTQAEGLRSQLDSDYAGLELDVATMDLKGTGPVTENERLIARKKLGGLYNPDAKTAYDILEQQKAEAQAIIDQATGGQAAPPAAGMEPSFEQAHALDQRLTPDVWARMPPEAKRAWMTSQ